MEQLVFDCGHDLAANRVCAWCLFSAAIKGIPTEILEAARVDGATEVRVFSRLSFRPSWAPSSRSPRRSVIFTLKIFDVVWVMTGGQFNTQVIATQFYREYFTAQNAGYGSAIAIVLFVLVIPVMIYNVRAIQRKAGVLMAA